MFRENVDYQQHDLFGFESRLTNKQKKYFENSTESTFFTEIFHKINERDFSCLYSKSVSRPNVPVNQLVGALILKHLHNWTYSDLFQNLNFNSLSRYAIGISDPHQDIFAEASIFNFQNRLVAHYDKTGEDLINKVFINITTEHIKQYTVKTGVQRGDSFLVDSNVIDYSKLRLLIEVLQRLHRILDTEDTKVFSEHLSKYLSKTSGMYVFEIRKQDIKPEYEQIAEVYYLVNHLLSDKYINQESYTNFKRVYREYFKEQDGGQKIEIKPNKESKSSNLKTPDDPDATFSSKYGKSHIGYSTHISETRNPENDVELITDIVVAKNNVSDDKILEQRIEDMKTKMPDWEEYFIDSAYGNEKVDRLTEQHNINLYQRAIKGRRSKSNIRIHKEKRELKVSCGGGQKVSVSKTETGYKAEFDINVCATCSLAGICKTIKTGGKFVPKKNKYYFNDKNVLAHLRIQNIEKIPIERRSIRSNVEATVKEMKRGMKNGKVRVRRWIRVSMHMIFTALSVNLRRIHLKTI